MHKTLKLIKLFLITVTIIFLHNEKYIIVKAAVSPNPNEYEITANDTTPYDRAFYTKDQCINNNNIYCENILTVKDPSGNILNEYGVLPQDNVNSNCKFFENGACAPCRIYEFTTGNKKTYKSIDDHKLGGEDYGITCGSCSGDTGISMEKMFIVESENQGLYVSTYHITLNNSSTSDGNLIMNNLSDYEVYWFKKLFDNSKVNPSICVSQSAYTYDDFCRLREGIGGYYVNPFARYDTLGNLDNWGKPDALGCFRLYQIYNWYTLPAVPGLSLRGPDIPAFRVPLSEQDDWINNSPKCINPYKYGGVSLSNCDLGNFFSPARDNDNYLMEGNELNIFCGDSFNLYNLANGKNCFGNYNDDRPVLCGKLLPDDDQQVQMCSLQGQYNECVEIEQGNPELGVINRPQIQAVENFLDDNDRSGNNARDIARTLPDYGICMNCVEPLEDCEVITDSNLNNIGIIDNCCDNQKFCNPATKGCDNKPLFETCEGQKTAEELNTSADIYIKGGEICNYSYDADLNNHCDKCSVLGTPTKDGLDNDLCPNIGARPLPSAPFYEYDTQCNNTECGCIGTDVCSNNECVPEDTCAVTGKDNPLNLDCCDGNAQRDPADDNICKIECTPPNHDPGTTCLDICCKNSDPNQECDINNQCTDSSCASKTDGECCGPLLSCNGGNCESDTTGRCGSPLIGRPPKGGSTRPEEMFTLEEFLQSIVGILYPLAIIMGMGFIIFGGYQLTTSTGDPEKVKKARQTLTSAIVGLIFVILSATILRFVVSTIIGI